LCNWIIGEERVAAEILANIVAEDNKLYGIPVTFQRGAVGAMLVPPSMKPQP
jgi:hypothetical protein